MYAPPSPCSAYDITTLHKVEPEAELGAIAPDFFLPQRFHERHLSDLRGTPIILVFAPLGHILIHNYLVIFPQRL